MGASIRDNREARDRAENGLSLETYPQIWEWYGARGIPFWRIKPRQNVLTRRAWLAKGREPIKGAEPCPVSMHVRRFDGSGLVDRRTVHLFHIDQTESLEALAKAKAERRRAAAYGASKQAAKARTERRRAAALRRQLKAEREQRVRAFFDGFLSIFNLGA